LVKPHASAGRSRFGHARQAPRAIAPLSGLLRDLLPACLRGCLALCLLCAAGIAAAQSPYQPGYQPWQFRPMPPSNARGVPPGAPAPPAESTASQPPGSVAPSAGAAGTPPATSPTAPPGFQQPYPAGYPSAQGAPLRAAKPAAAPARHQQRQPRHRIATPADIDGTCCSSRSRAQDQHPRQRRPRDRQRVRAGHDAAARRSARCRPAQGHRHAGRRRPLRGRSAQSRCELDVRPAMATVRPWLPLRSLHIDAELDKTERHGPRPAGDPDPGAGGGGRHRWAAAVAGVSAALG
jgi:hypothetical protein